MKVLMSVNFDVAPVVIEVEAESFKDAWERRYDLAADAKPVAWEVHPSDIELPEAAA